MWLVPLIIYGHVMISWSAPTKGSFRVSSGVNLNGRKKIHGEGENCPTDTVNYCQCRPRGEGLDITCEGVNADQLAVSYFAMKVRTVRL